MLLCIFAILVVIDRFAGDYLYVSGLADLVFVFESEAGLIGYTLV